jgi:hypothetical protein
MTSPHIKTDILTALSYLSTPVTDTGVVTSFILTDLFASKLFLFIN